MIDVTLTTNRWLIAAWIVCVLAPAACSLIDVALWRLPGAVLYLTAGIAIVGGSVCATMANNHAVAKFLAVLLTITFVVVEIGVLGIVALMHSGLSGTQ